MDHEPTSILLVDDHPENLFSLKAMLAFPAHRLVTASSGEEAVGLLLLRQDFALILLDVAMPAMDGFEVARRLQQTERTRHIPIIFVTAVANDAQQLSEGYSVGAVDYLVKPLDVAIVRRKVGVFVDLYRQRQDAAATTEAKRQDCELRLAQLRIVSNQRYRKLAERIDFITGWSAMPETIRLSSVSGRARRRLGYTSAEFVAPDFWLRRVHAGDRERILAVFRQAIRDRTDQECVHRFLTADGEELWLRTSVTVEPAVGGGADEVEGISVDITDAKRAAEAGRDALLKQLDDANQRLLDLASDLDEAMVWEVDAATMQFSFVSRGGETVTGFPCAEWKGAHEFWSAHLPAEDWATLEAAFGRSRFQATEERCEHRFIRRDGAVRWLRTTIHFRTSGERARFHGVTLDITAGGAESRAAARPAT
jgi:PAS domain S-box-containing protein